MPVDSLPAVRAQVRIAEHSATGIGDGLLRDDARAASPTAESAARGSLLPVAERQERNLHGQRQLPGHLQIRLRSPEEEASRERNQVQLAGQVGPPDRLGQACERPEGEQILDVLQRFPLTPEVRGGPRRQRVRRDWIGIGD